MIFWNNYQTRIRSKLWNAWSWYLSSVGWLIPSIASQADDYISRIRKNLKDTTKWISTEAAINQWIITWSFTKAWVPIQAAAASIADANRATSARIAEQQGLADQKEFATIQSTASQIANLANAEDSFRQNAFTAEANNQNKIQELASSAASYWAPWVRKPAETYQQFIKRILAGN